MANPTVTVTPPSGTLAPGSNVVFTWTVVDEDNRSITFEWNGTDSQGNPVTGSGSLDIQDVFTMNTFVLGGATLTIDNANRRATGVVPSA